LYGCFILLDPLGKTLKFWKSALVNLGEPGIQALSFPMPHHLKKVLHELIGGIERHMCQTKSRQIFSLDLVQMLWTTHE